MHHIPALSTPRPRRTKRRRWLIPVVAVAATASWLQLHGNPITSDLTDLLPRSTATPVAPLDSTVAELLDAVEVINQIDHVDGYDRDCGPGDAPLTEPTAQSAQV